MANTVQPQISVGKDLFLRPFRSSDAASVLSAFSTPDIQYWHCRKQDTLAEAQSWIQESLRRWRAETAATWAITTGVTGDFVGRVSLNTDLYMGCGEVAYWVLPQGRGNSVATRAAVAATSWAHNLGIHRVILQHSTQNTASERVANKAGFMSEGIQRQGRLASRRLARHAFTFAPVL